MQNTRADARETYRERLSPGLGLLVTIALAGPMAALVLAPIDASLALGAGGLVSLLLVALSITLSPTVRVVDGVLHAGRAHIDARWLGEPVHRTGDRARVARAHGLDRTGWNLLRGGVDGVVIVPITDPDDPVTSWTISSRTPDRLAAAIGEARRLQG